MAGYSDATINRCGYTYNLRPIGSRRRSVPWLPHWLDSRLWIMLHMRAARFNAAVPRKLTRAYRRAKK